MLSFLLRRFLRALIVLLAVTLITFLLVHAIPGNPWTNYSTMQRVMPGLSMDPPLLRELERRFGLDLPLWRQYTRYIIGDFDAEGTFDCGVICGNLGPSTQQKGRSVQNVLFGPPEDLGFWESQFGYSIRLVLLGCLIAVGLGIPLGIRLATKPNSAASHAISVSLTALISIPNFVLGLLAIIVLASWLKVMNVLPDWDDPNAWIVPAVVLAVMPMASIARVTRASLMNILNEDYIRTARGKGLTEARVMLVHIMRNALVPIVTFLGPALMEMFTGLLIVENLFSFPGFGRGYWRAVLALDYPLIMGLTLIYAIGIVVLNALVEVACEILDPRLRSVKQQGAP
jgi:oligopeptide transport system permease protein